jgi:hypothetical protein
MGFIGEASRGKSALLIEMTPEQEQQLERLLILWVLANILETFTEQFIDEPHHTE